MHSLYTSFFETGRNILAFIGAGSVLCTMGIFLFAFVAHMRKDLRKTLDSDNPRKRQD
jgi:hypothetical protein